MSSLIKEFGAERVIETLAPFLSDRRLARIHEVLGNRLDSIHLACENPSDLHNALAIVRTAEAYGVTNIHLIKPYLRARRVGKSTTKGAIKWSHLMRYQDSAEFLSKHENKNRVLVGASLEGEYTLDSLPVDKPITLVFGNEKEGLSPELAKACTYRYKIPMYGFVESFNLAVSAAITLYDVTNRRRKYITDNEYVDPEVFEHQKALYYIRAVGGGKAGRYLRSKHSSL